MKHKNENKDANLHYVQIEQTTKDKTMATKLSNN